MISYIRFDPWTLLFWRTLVSQKLVNIGFSNGLTEANHYLKQYWLDIRDVLWYSHEGNLFWKYRGKAIANTALSNGWVFRYISNLQPEINETGGC